MYGSLPLLGCFNSSEDPRLDPLARRRVWSMFRGDWCGEQ
jgi:hypothetical protein